MILAAIDRAACAALDWMDRFQAEHPKAAVVALVALATLGYGVVGALE